LGQGYASTLHFWQSYGLPELPWLLGRSLEISDLAAPPPPRQVTAYSRQRYGLSHTTGRSVAEHRIERGAGVPRSQSEFYSEKLLVRRRHFGGRP
jgi:hypothetical protein